MSIRLLKQQLESAPIIKKGDYRYIINPICEQEPPLQPSILTDCADRLLEKLDWKNATKILTPEAMGIHIATLISVKTNLPMIIATHRRKRIQEERQVQYTCGYEKGELHINSIDSNDRILLIDDLISTGGTLIALIQGLNAIGANVSDIGVIFNKPDYGGMKELQKMSFDPKCLLNVTFGEKLNVELI